MPESQPTYPEILEAAHLWRNDMKVPPLPSVVKTDEDVMRIKCLRDRREKLLDAAGKYGQEEWKKVHDLLTDEEFEEKWQDL